MSPSFNTASTAGLSVLSATTYPSLSTCSRACLTCPGVPDAIMLLPSSLASRAARIAGLLESHRREMSIFTESVKHYRDPHELALGGRKKPGKLGLEPIFFVARFKRPV